MKVFWKKTMARIIIVCMLIAAVYPANTAEAASKVKSYSDVAGHKHEVALLYAISNGLMSNSGSLIFPDSALTKGAACISLNALLGATKMYDMTSVKNLKKGDKYYNTVAIGLNAGYLLRQDNGNIYNPLNKATYGYVESIFSSTLGVDMKSMIIGDKKAGDFLTRGEFAEILLKVAPNIITKSTKVNNLNEGDVYIAAPNLNIANINVNGNLIITDAVGNQEVNLINVTVTGKLIVRGGGENSIIIRGNSKIPEVIMKQVNENASIKVQGTSEVELVTVLTNKATTNIQGKVKRATFKANGSKIVLKNAVIGNITIDGEGSEIEMIETVADGININAAGILLEMTEGSTTKHIDMTKDADNAIIQVAENAVVNAITGRADNVKVRGKGKVDYVAIEGKESDITTDGTIVDDKIPEVLPVLVTPTPLPATDSIIAPPANESTPIPTTAPTAVPTATPTTAPTAVPTVIPTTAPTAVPTAIPTTAPIKPVEGPELRFNVDNFWIVCDDYFSWNQDPNFKYGIDIVNESGKSIITRSLNGFSEGLYWDAIPFFIGTQKNDELVSGQYAILLYSYEYGDNGKKNNLVYYDTKLYINLKINDNPYEITKIEYLSSHDSGTVTYYNYNIHCEVENESHYLYSYFNDELINIGATCGFGFKDGRFSEDVTSFTVQRFYDINYSDDTISFTMTVPQVEPIKLERSDDGGGGTPIVTPTVTPTPVPSSELELTFDMEHFRITCDDYYSWNGDPNCIFMVELKDRNGNILTRQHHGYDNGKYWFGISYLFACHFEANEFVNGPYEISLYSFEYDKNNEKTNLTYYDTKLYVDLDINDTPYPIDYILYRGVEDTSYGSLYKYEIKSDYNLDSWYLVNEYNDELHLCAIGASPSIDPSRFNITFHEDITAITIQQFSSISFSGDTISFTMTASQSEPIKLERTSIQYDENDYNALLEIIQQQKDMGALVSEDLDSYQYNWDVNGRLIGIYWDGLGLQDKLDVNRLTNLTDLGCSNNQLIELDVSQLINLYSLNCSNNQLTRLDVSNLTNLAALECSNNQLIELEVSKLTNLMVLYCSNNQLAKLDVYNLVNLIDLECSDNQLIKLDVSNLTNLIRLFCANNQIFELNIGELINLTHLECSDNQLIKLDVSNLTNLIRLSCANNQIFELNIGELTKLIDLDCYLNQITELDVSELINLTHLRCSNNQLFKLDVRNLTNLIDLNCGSNQITELDVNKLINLTNLNCAINQITKLDIENLINLRTLFCWSNELSILNVSDLINLTTLNCSNNELNELDVSELKNLTILACSNNELNELDVSELVSLTDLNCSNNKLNELDVSKLVNLTYLACTINELSGLDVSDLVKLTELYCNSNQIAELDVRNLTSLTDLGCWNNELNVLDVKDLINLTWLDCSDNHLKTLDVRKLINLVYLVCSDNELSELDVAELTNLTCLDCSFNSLPLTVYVSDLTDILNFYYDSNVTVIKKTL